MSYDLKILKDNPIGYWSFNNTANDLTSNANNAVITSVSYVSPPIIANSGSALKITNTSSVVISNTAGNYEAFSKYFENQTFTICFWFSLNNYLNGSGYNSTPYSNNQLTLFSIKSGSVVIGKIYYDYLSNTIRFSISGTDNNDAYYVVNDLDKQFYVVATYSNKSTSIIVNGIPGESGSILDISTMPSYSKTSLSFVIDGSSLNGTSTSPQNFLINSLAFFDYNLNQEQIKNHILWAGNTEKPLFQGSLSSSTSLFTFSVDPSEQGTYKTISGSDFGNLGTVTNLSVTKDGLQPLVVSDNVFNKDYDSTATYSISTSSGISWSGSAGVDFLNFNDYFSLTNGFVVGGSLYRTAGSTSYVTNGGEYVFGISNVNNGKYLFLEYKYVSSSWQYNLNLYNPSDATTTTLLTAYNTNFVNDNFALKIDSNSIQMEILTSTSGSSVNILSTSSENNLPLSLGTNSTLTLGNSYHNPKTFLSSINYINLGNFSITSSSLRSIYSSSYLTTPMTFMFNMSSSLTPFFVSQHGKWEFVLPSSNISNSYVQGTAFDWKSMDNCKVTISYNGGATFSALNRSQTATGYDLTKSSKNLVINVDIFTTYDMDANYQSFNNFSYAFYDNLDIYSDSEYYKISIPSDRTLANYIPQVNDGNILSRPENFGIKFTGDANKKQGYGLLEIPASATYSAIEFWYRPDSIDFYRTNLIQNPSSEVDGRGWFGLGGVSSITSSDKLFGSKSASVSASFVGINTYLGFAIANNDYSRIAVDSNTTYTLSAYIKDISTGSPGFAAINFYDSSGNYISQASGSQISTSSSYWTRVSVTAKTPSNAATIYALIFTTLPITSSANNGKSFIVDGALLEKSSTLNTYFDGAYTGNIAFNSSFEGTGGTFAQSSILAITSSTSYIGSNSLLITASYTGFNGNPGYAAVNSLGQPFSVTAGEVYTFSAYVKDINTGSAFRTSMIFYNGASYVSQVTSSYTNVSSSGWTRVFGTASVPSGATTMYPALFSALPLTSASSPGNGRSFYVDASMLEKSSSVNEYVDSTMIAWTGASALSTSRLGNSYLLNNVDNNFQSPAIWISSSSKFQSLGGTLYINGASVADNTYGASANEIYHITLVLSASNTSNLYLNKNSSLIPSTSNKSTYGYLQIWNTSPAASDILSRYNQFIGKVPAKIIDNNTTKVVSTSSTDRFVITKIG